MENNQGVLVRKSENWYNLYINSIGVGSTHKELQGYKLSITNCNKITKGYDLDELAKQKYPNVDNEDFEYNSEQEMLRDKYKKSGFLQGAKAIIEILRDKKFSEDDMMRFFKWAYQQVRIKGGDETSLELLQNWKLIQQTEWKVEIVTELEGHTNTGIPKLDLEGCIILKLIN